MYNQLHIFNKGKKQIITTLLLVTSGSRETNQNDHTTRERTFLWVNYCVSVCVCDWRKPVAVLQLCTGWQTSPQCRVGRHCRRAHKLHQQPFGVAMETKLCSVGCGGGALSTAAANGTAPSNQMRLHNELVMKSPHGCSACVLGPV